LALELFILRYLARCEAVNIDFTTFVVDSIGGIHPDAAELITRIVTFWAQSRDCLVTLARTRLMQRIYFCVKRSLAAEYSNPNFEYDDLDPIAIIGEENEGVGGLRKIIMRLALELFISEFEHVIRCARKCNERQNKSVKGYSEVYIYTAAHL
jgi:hypothetical protein